MSAGLLSKWMGHPNVANMHRRAPMARGRMQGYDIEDDSSEFVDQFPGNKIFKADIVQCCNFLEYRPIKVIQNRSSHFDRTALCSTLTISGFV